MPAYKVYGVLRETCSRLRKVIVIYHPSSFFKTLLIPVPTLELYSCEQLANHSACGIRLLYTLSVIAKYYWHVFSEPFTASLIYVYQKMRHAVRAWIQFMSEPEDYTYDAKWLEVADVYHCSSAGVTCFTEHQTILPICRTVQPWYTPEAESH